MILTKYDLAQLQRPKSTKIRERNSPPRRKGRVIHESQRQQILMYPGRVVSLSTAQRRLQKWPKMSLHDACTVEDMSRKSAGRWQ